MESGATRSRSARAVHALLAADDLTRILRDCYAVGPNATLTVLSLAVNSIYRIDDGPDRYVLRVSPSGHRTRELLNSELAFVEHLAAQGVRVGEVIRARSGDPAIGISAPDGDRLGAVFRYVPGRSAALTNSDAFAVGIASAEVHTHAADYSGLPGRRRYDLVELLDRPVDRIARSFGHRPNDVTLLRQVAERVKSAVGPGLADQATQPIHGDLQQKNAFLDDAGHGTMIDFDECGWGWPIDDVASWAMASRWLGGEPSVEASFLEGYASVRPLSALEVHVLPWLVIARSMYWMGWQLDGTRDWGPVAWLGDDWLTTHVASLTSQVESLAR